MIFFLKFVFVITLVCRCLTQLIKERDIIKISQYEDRRCRNQGVDYMIKFDGKCIKEGDSYSKFEVVQNNYNIKKLLFWKGCDENCDNCMHSGIKIKANECLKIQKMKYEIFSDKDIVYRNNDKEVFNYYFDNLEDCKKFEFFENRTEIREDQMTLEEMLKVDEEDFHSIIKEKEEREQREKERKLQHFQETKKLLDEKEYFDYINMHRGTCFNAGMKISERIFCSNGRIEKHFFITPDCSNEPIQKIPKDSNICLFDSIKKKYYIESCLDFLSEGNQEEKIENETPTQENEL